MKIRFKNYKTDVKKHADITKIKKYMAMSQKSINEGIEFVHWFKNRN